MINISSTNKLEIACFNLESVQIAEAQQVDRIEWCADQSVGGITPEIELTKKARSIANRDLIVMIRPRAGNFVYTKEEFLQMKTQIRTFKNLGVNGFVFGLLDSDFGINIAQNLGLVEEAYPFPCTFHRAFDEVKQPEDALEKVIECGFTTLLTSGQASNILEGAETVSKWIQKAENRIVIMPGGGLRSQNCAWISEKTQAHFYHSSAIIDSGNTADAEEIKALQQGLKCKTIF